MRVLRGQVNQDILMLMKHQPSVDHWAGFTVSSETLLFFQMDFIERFNITEGLQMLHIVVLTNKELLIVH